MFYDSGSWPPPPDGYEPPAGRRAITPREERVIMRLIGFFLLALFLAPLGGSSVVAAIVTLFAHR